MYIIKCLPSSYHPYSSKWFYYYGHYNSGVGSGLNFNFCKKFKTYREALDKAKSLWYDYNHETKILKV